MILGYVVVFIVYSFLGWIVDDSYRYLYGEKYLTSGYFNMPFKPVYGFGAMTMVALASTFGAYPIWAKILIYGVVMSVVEYIAGIYVELTINRKLWDYSNQKFNLHGRVSLLHTFYWVLLAFFFEIVMFPKTFEVMNSLEIVPNDIQMMAFMAFVGLGGILIGMRISEIHRMEIQDVLIRNNFLARNLDAAKKGIAAGRTKVSKIHGRIKDRLNKMNLLRK